MTPRERILAAVVVVIAVGYGGYSIHNRINSSYDRVVTQVTAADEAHFEAQIKSNQGMQQAARLKEWKERSLPSDTYEARSLYREWLLSVLTSAGLDNLDVVPQTNMGSRDELSKLTFRVSADGTFSQVTEFLFGFYMSRNLHKIRQITLTPDGSAESFQVSLNIEALSLNDSMNESVLAEGESEWLSLSSVQEYLDEIVERNIFKVYEPPRVAVAPPPKEENVDKPPPKPKFDHVKHAQVNGITASNDQWIAFINVHTTGDKHWLREGDSFSIGDFKARIVSINSRAVVYESDGERYSVKLGKSLRDGEKISAESAS